MSDCHFADIVCHVELLSSDFDHSWLYLFIGSRRIEFSRKQTVENSDRFWLHCFLLNCSALTQVAQWLTAGLSIVSIGFIGMVAPRGVFHNSIGSPQGQVFMAAKV
jgi:hypothetical protein